MIRLNRLFISKVFAVALVFLLLHGPVYGNKNHPQHNFSAAEKAYNQGFYKAAAAKLEALLSSKETIGHSLKAKIFLLLGAGYEKSGQEEKAKDSYLELRKLLDSELIEAIPEIPVVDPDSLPVYRKMIGTGAFFKFKEPPVVQEVLQERVLEAPRKSIEQKEEEKKKKRFPWLIAIGSVIIIGTAAVLIFLSKKSSGGLAPPAIDWVHVPAGEFSMGDNFNEGAADEQPVHKVYLDGYYISEFEITKYQYYIFCESVNRPFSYNMNPSYPVANISWFDAKAFCDWLSSKTGENIHLPTEAQWEKAARSTDQRRYPWGNGPPEDDWVIFSRSLIEGTGYIKRQIRSAGISPYGAYDMAGNAAEWCADWYSASYYSISPVNNPTGPASGSFRVVRGGGYTDEAEGIRSAKRDFHDPSRGTQRIGFRIVKEID